MKPASSIDTKMANGVADHKSNNIIRDDAEAIAFKQFYKSTLIDKGIRQEEEGHNLWKSQAQVAKYVSDYSGVHLSAYEVPKSLIANDIMGWLANELGGHYTPSVGQLNGSIKDELSAILKAASVITACDDNPTKCKAEFKRIMKCAERALEELG